MSKITTDTLVSQLPVIAENPALVQPQTLESTTDLSTQDTIGDDITNKTPSLSTHSTSSVQCASDYSTIVNENDRGLYKSDGYYVGTEKEFPVAKPVKSAWESIVGDLVIHLQRISLRLKQSIPLEKRIIEPELCMAGRKPTLHFGNSRVKLIPTVWIRCGSSSCQRKVTRTISELSYLTQFLQAFKMGSTIITRQSPWPAGFTQPPYLSVLPGDITQISLAIRCFNGPGDHFPICGTQARYTVRIKGSNSIHLYSTVGGAVMASGRIYGLTTAHSIADFLQQHIPDPNASPELVDDSDGASTSDSDSESDSNDASLISPDQSLSSNEKWIEIPLPTSFMYKGFGTSGRDLSFCGSREDTSDFALMNIQSIPKAVNGFYDPEYGTYSDVDGYLSIQELGRGKVRIITSSIDGPTSGYMLEGDARIILSGKTMRTRKIQINFKAVRGLSGAWVVQDRKLCGIIYAAYDHAPYLHMIPAYTMFENIKDAFKLNTTVAAFDLDQKPSSIVFPSSPSAKNDERRLPGSGYLRPRVNLRWLEFQEENKYRIPGDSELENDGTVRWRISGPHRAIMTPDPTPKLSILYQALQIIQERAGKFSFATRTQMVSVAMVVVPLFGILMMAAIFVVPLIGLLAIALALVESTTQGRNMIRTLFDGGILGQVFALDLNLASISYKIREDTFRQRVWDTMTRYSRPLWEGTNAYGSGEPYVIGAAIVEQLGISPPSSREHTQVALAVLDTRSQVNLINERFARQLGWREGHPISDMIAQDIRLYGYGLSQSRKGRSAYLEDLGYFPAAFTLLSMDQSCQFQPPGLRMRRHATLFIVIDGFSLDEDIDVIIGMEEIKKHSLLVDSWKDIHMKSPDSRSLLISDKYAKLKIEL
ncbi:hypothetical protein BS50DRAFT_622647 [Corynespora cassiicola Philippines]|uniref:Uncharacterized protein n=1 Tax=Corynespora cassiicola Philippines TaxID=1448308 RepID=A0A2T2NK61_CORCC|nr:hypothetical protein BS50DRAFT_622647 [Corynespora cassiicola Philippines]